MKHAAGYLLDRLAEGHFFIQKAVGDYPVTFRLLEEFRQHGFVLLEYLKGAGFIPGVHLCHSLRLCPLVLAVNDSRFLILRVDVQDNDVPVHLEHIVETGRRNIRQCEKRFPLGKIRGVAGKYVTECRAYVAFPVFPVNDKDYFSGLAAHVGEQFATGSVFAGRGRHEQSQHAGRQKCD